MIEASLDRHPVSVELVYGRVQIVLVKVFGGLVQSAGRSQERAAGVIDQRPLGAGKKHAAQDHGFEQPGGAPVGHETKESV